jgi:hypothetical protein
MKTSLIILIVSVVAMLVMVGLRSTQLKLGDKFFVYKFIKWCDSAAVAFGKKYIWKYILIAERAVVAFFKKIPVWILKLVSKIHLSLYKKYGKHIEHIKKGKIDIEASKKLSTSAFVSAINEYRKEMNG